MLFDMNKQIDFWKPKYICEKANPKYIDKISKKQESITMEISFLANGTVEVKNS